MSGRLLMTCMLVGLCLLGGDARAQKGEKISEMPVPELEKEKLGVVDSTRVAMAEDVSPDVMALENDKPYSSVHDSSNVSARTIPESTLDGFRSNPNYQYDRVETGGPSLWDLFWEWMNDALFRPIRENTSSEFWSWFWLVAGILAIAFVITKALQSDGGGFFQRKDVPLEIAGLELLDTEDIEGIDLDAMLQAAVGDQRYRDAARFFYLRALQGLTEKGLIEWNKHKTNRDYLSEVRRAGHPILNGRFADITRLFEWIWYGEFPVDEERFALVRARFDLFSEALRGVNR